MRVLVQKGSSGCCAEVRLEARGPERRLGLGLRPAKMGAIPRGGRKVGALRGATRPFPSLAGLPSCHLQGRERPANCPLLYGGNNRLRDAVRPRKYTEGTGRFFFSGTSLSPFLRGHNL